MAFSEPEDYRSAVSALAVRISEPFIVIAPTIMLFQPDVIDILNLRKAALFTLSDMFVVDSSGKMSAHPSCKGLLARFRAKALGVGQGRTDLLCLDNVFHYSQDFHCVQLNDREFTLTSTQSHVIEALVNAYRNGTPDVSKDYILEEIGSSLLCKRLRDIFTRDREAFNCLIRSGKKRGTYRLNI
jgi:hypothetical protein